jgi:hypothetical protein
MATKTIFQSVFEGELGRLQTDLEAVADQGKVLKSKDEDGRGLLHWAGELRLFLERDDRSTNVLA